MPGSRDTMKFAPFGPAAPVDATDERRVAPVCLRSLQDESVRARLDQKALFSGLAFTASDLEVPGWTLPHRQASKMVRNALKQTADPDLGFHTGMRSKITHRGALALGSVSSATLGEAMALSIRFPVSSGHLLRVQQESSSRQHRWVAEPLSGDHDIEAFLVDELFAGTVSLWRRISGTHYAPAAVEMIRARSANARSLERFFGCAVSFGSLHNRLVSDIKWLNFALPLASAAAFRQSVDILIGENADVVRTTSTPLSVELQILNQLPVITSPAQLASTLHMSERSLRRKLAGQSISYRQLLDDCRKSRALELLLVGRRSVAEAAAQTGFASVGSFHRAFKRWTGSSASATAAGHFAAASG